MAQDRHNEKGRWVAVGAGGWDGRCYHSLMTGQQIQTRMVREGGGGGSEGSGSGQAASSM